MPYIFNTTCPAFAIEVHQKKQNQVRLDLDSVVRFTGENVFTEVIVKHKFLDISEANCMLRRENGQEILAYMPLKVKEFGLHSLIDNKKQMRLFRAETGPCRVPI